MKRPDILISNYTYNLPDNRIAKFPLSRRDASKLLVYRKGNISESLFSDLPDQLSAESLLVFNNTKVIQARLKFKRLSGAIIEIFCLDPVLPKEYSQVFASKESCEWNCIVGNLKKWKEEELVFVFDVEGKTVHLKASKKGIHDTSVQVLFSWDQDICFSQVLEASGAIPIPPYLHRESEKLDEERYQTVYSKFLGSVAAPTAGLHFTEEVLVKLREKHIILSEITLHVGAGTFKPVKSESISSHQMHAELFSVHHTFLGRLLAQIISGNPIIAVGTTSVRTLESLYWLGCEYLANEYPIPCVTQWTPYDQTYTYSSAEAIQALIDHMDRNDLMSLEASTQIMIAPSYQFRLVDQIITNFHQPQSTLLLLIGAFIGTSWQQVYRYALENDFRFLSYGDSSLLIP